MAEQADVLIAEVPKNGREVVQIRRRTYNGTALLDARVWTVPPAPGDESKPTKKGLCLRPETWVELVAVIAREAGGDDQGQ